LTGGADAHVFIFRGTGGTDTITGFETGADRIRIRDAVGIDSFEDLTIANNGNGHAAVSWGTADSATLENVDEAALTAGDFMLF